VVRDPKRIFVRVEKAKGGKEAELNAFAAKEVFVLEHHLGIAKGLTIS